MNIVLDWLVDNHKAASESAWKQSTLVQSDSELNFSGELLIIKSCRYDYQCNSSFTSPIWFSGIMVNSIKKSLVFHFFITNFLLGIPQLANRSFEISSTGLFKSTFTMKIDGKSIQTYYIHQDQALSIKAFLKYNEHCPRLVGRQSQSS